jgi:tetratricopeptide (TPR) repeat protein
MRWKVFILVCLLTLLSAACGRRAAQGNNRAGVNANDAAANANANLSSVDAQAALASGKLDAEITQLEAEAERNPEDDAARTALAAAYIRRGDALHAANRLDEAQRDYQSAQRIDPDNEEAQLRLEQLDQESGAEPRADDGRPVTVPAKKQ